MAPPDSSSKKEPTHFEVLALTPKSLEGQDAPTQTKAVKQAYRRALLKHHPDKNQQAKLQSDNSNNGSSAQKKKTEVHYTVDQITEAYTVLSDAKKRREYIRSLQTRTTTTRTTFNTTSTTRTSSSSSPPGRRASSASATNHHHQHHQQQQQRPASFRTGVETVDLDDLAFDEVRGVYYRSCRCGSARGYCFRELDLEEVGEEGELMVECVGCSLWLRVLFEELDEDDEYEENSVQQQRQQVQPQQQQGMKEVHRSSGSGQSGGFSWKFSLGISIGGSVGVGARAGRA